jgi:flagellar hook-basal body complex protein FliE
MDILKTTLVPIKPVVELGTASAKTEDQSVGFGEVFKQALNEVNGLQQQSSQMKTQLLTGQADDIHQVMIAAEKADLAFQLTLQIRNKVIEAYQEIMRMQV